MSPSKVVRDGMGGEMRVAAPGVSCWGFLLGVPESAAVYHRKHAANALHARLCHLSQQWLLLYVVNCDTEQSRQWLWQLLSFVTQDRANSEVKAATSEDYASIQMTLIPQAAASSGIWGCDYPASPPYRQPADDRMPEIQAHVTLGLVGQAVPCAQIVIGADGGGADLDLSTGSLRITNHCKQVCKIHK